MKLRGVQFMAEVDVPVAATSAQLASLAARLLASLRTHVADAEHVGDAQVVHDPPTSSGVRLCIFFPRAEQVGQMVAELDTVARQFFDDVAAGTG